MFHNQFFLLIFEKNLILRSILEYFFAFLGTFRISRFPDSRFQKIWKSSGNCCFWQIATCWVFFPLSFVPWVWFFGQKFWIFIFWDFPDSRKFGKSLENAVFDNFGYFSHSVLVSEYDIQLRIFEISISWNFHIPDSRKSGNSLKITVFDRELAFASRDPSRE